MGRKERDDDKQNKEWSNEANKERKKNDKKINRSERGSRDPIRKHIQIPGDGTRPNTEPNITS